MTEAEQREHRSLESAIVGEVVHGVHTHIIMSDVGPTCCFGSVPSLARPSGLRILILGELFRRWDLVQ
jgi:hypothetical protein